MPHSRIDSWSIQRRVICGAAFVVATCLGACSSEDADGESAAAGSAGSSSANSVSSSAAGTGGTGGGGGGAGGQGGSGAGDPCADPVAPNEVLDASSDPERGDFTMSEALA